MSLKRNRKHHHNPVDSLHRRIRTINMLDQTSNPALQIPKFQSKNFDSPQSNTKKNLEELLKKRTLKTSENDNRPNDDTSLLTPGSEVFSLYPPILSTPSPRHISNIHSLNATFSIDRNKGKLPRFLPTVGFEGDSSPPFLRHRESVSGQLLGAFNAEQKHASPWERNCFSSSPNLYVYQQTPPQPVFQTPTAQRPPSGRKVAAEMKEAEENSDVSLICEEDLLTTIFYACDVERRGKVAVSKIVDFLRHTTSRGPEDSNLEELCSMLDPDQRDISMDLETYHAIMKEWIEDCRREVTTDIEDPAVKLQDSSLAAKRTPVRMNITSGSLEALGGDVSRGDLETSDLITCIADLQFNNQKLQEENSQLKLALDTMEEANNRLMENIEELRNQIKSFQQSMIGVRSLKEELEEMKISLNSSEENRLKMSAQKKQLEKENHSLNLKISSLQEENIRNSLDLDGLQKKVIELTQSTAELQMQMHLYENTVANKDTVLLKKDLDIQELKSSLKEYSSVLETLRGEKNKLVNTVQQMQQELISNGISIPLLCKFNSSILEGSHSLHCELELAQEQSQIIGFEWTALDESLNREVLLLLQGPEQVGDKFKDTIQKLQEELYHLEDFAGFDAVWTADSDTNVQEAYEKKLVNLKQHLGNKRTLWLKKLEILDTQKGSLDKELIKMAGNLRRMRTEQLHLKKELASKQHEVELVKQLKEDAVSEGDILRLSLQKETKLLEDANSQIKDLESNLQVACENAISLQKRLEESFAERGLLHAINVNLIHSCQELELKTKEHSTILDLLRDKNIKGVFSGVLYKKTCCYKRLGAQEFLCFGLSWLPTLQRWCLEYSPLLDALTLDSLQLIRGSFMIKAYGNLSNSEEQHLNDGSVLIVTLERCKCSNYSMGNQTYADLLSGTRMDADCTEESSAVLLTDVLSSSEQVSSQEVSSSTLEGSSEAQDINSTLPNAMEEKFCEVSPGMEEATTVEEANEEDQTAVFGNDSSAENLSNNALTRNREKGIISPNEKEMEAEFLRLSLGFKCDLFTLEKRVRLEERSRDLAEGNLKKEIATALKLLESLASLSEDNQIQEIVKKLEKSLELLNQYAIRVASKAEMLGAIHQSSSLRRVSIATLPRNTGNAGTGLPMAQLNDTDWNDKCDKVSRRASWGLVAAKQGEKRPLLQRYISSHSWTESEEEQPETESIPLERPASEIRGNKMQKLSEKENSSPRWGLYSVYTRVLSWASCLRTSKAFCIYATTAVLFAFLSSLILGLSFQRPVDAAPAETGDAWTSVQQLLWPYIGLRHQGPPPV